MKKNLAIAHTIDYPISFGDCDPAGIVYYPNTYAWFDRAFHYWFRRFGGHEAICRELGAIGIGVLRARAGFRRPMRDGDNLFLKLFVQDWGRQTLTLSYEGRVAEDVAVVGTEVRGLFRLSSGAIVAGAIEPLRAIVGGDDEG
jgi:4-hydroxybenzoyl-CoA thioesterase